MKKFIGLLLTLVSMLALVGCVQQKEEPTTPTGYPTGKIEQPQIMYNGQVYFCFATGFDEPLPDDYELVGSVSAVDNDNAPTEDFHGAGVGSEQEVYASEVNTETVYVKYENGYAQFTIKNHDTIQNQHLANNDTANFQMPEEGYYSNDYDEILRIKKEDDGTYNILEYGITHLLYVENAVGIYNSETGILEFSGKDDRGNDIKAEIENKGDYLEVTVTQSSYENIIGTKQEFFQIENNISEQNSAELQWDIIPMVMVKDKLYYDTGKESTLDGRCGVMDGKITSTVDGSEVPTQNDQSNFGTGFEYQYGSDDTIEIFMNEKWIIFEQRDDIET